jgi:hypothetical protein
MPGQEHFQQHGKSNTLLLGSIPYMPLSAKNYCGVCKPTQYIMQTKHKLAAICPTQPRNKCSIPCGLAQMRTNANQTSICSSPSPTTFSCEHGALMNVLALQFQLPTWSAAAAAYMHCRSGNSAYLKKDSTEVY